MLLHADNFTHRRFDTQTLLQKHFHTQKLFEHRRFYTKKRLHTETGPVKSQVYLSFRRSKLISCERVAPDTYKSQFYPSFWRSNLISCERVRRTLCKSQFYFSFWRSNLISCEKVATGTRKSQFYLSFLRSNLVSCERVAFRAVSLALPRAFKREIDKKEKARGQERM